MQFYTLEWVVGVPYETDALDMDPRHLGASTKCPKCGIPVSSLSWLPPYRAEIRAFTGKFGDLAYGTGDDLLVSEKFRRAWEQSGLRGITEFAPLERMRFRPARLGRKPVTYYHIAVKQWGTRIDLSRSRLDHEDPIQCDKCQYGGIINSIRGFSIDESSWTGEDIFYAWGSTGCMIVTDRVRQLRDDHGLTNINLIPTEQYLWDPLHRWTPFGMTDDD
jgi:hypothetical protein